MFAFAKYHGAGNDFILIDDRNKVFPVSRSDWIAKLCHRRFGIGADGLILLQLSESGADYAMRIFNSDGKETKMCGNGLRCLAHFIRRMGDSRSILHIEVGSLMTICSFDGDNVKTHIGSYRWIEKGVQIGPYKVYAVHTGVPHAVVFDDFKSDFIEIARFIRFHPYFQPEGINVNFARLENGKVRTRTYERGVEDETLACGTGAAAVAIVASELHNLKEVSIFPASEEELYIKIDKDTVTVTGPATFVFGGVLDDYRDSKRDQES